MKSLKFSLFYSIVLCLFLISCNTKKELLPNSGGKPGEIIFIIEKHLWNSEIGDAIKKIFMEDYPALPQDEPTFDIHPIPFANFNDIFQSSRNIIKISFNPNSDSMYYRIIRDRWAKPQLIVELIAKDKVNMSKLIELYGNKIKELILKEERERLMNIYKKFKEKTLLKSLKKFNIELTIPKGYRLNIDTTNFIWISAETPYMSQGLFIYSIPYTDTSYFNVNKLVSIRDSVLKKYIPGPLEGTYMTTEHLFPPTEKRFLLDHEFVSEIRGLWKVENDYMGGPFIMIATVINNKLTILEGYVYAPKDDKKIYIWQLEAILYSLKRL